MRRGVQREQEVAVGPERTPGVMSQHTVVEFTVQGLFDCTPPPAARRVPVDDFERVASPMLSLQEHAMGERQGLIHRGAVEVQRHGLSVIL